MVFLYTGLVVTAEKKGPAMLTKHKTNGGASLGDLVTYSDAANPGCVFGWTATLSTASAFCRLHDGEEVSS